jgi:hypothetical protein
MDDGPHWADTLLANIVEATRTNWQKPTDLEHVLLGRRLYGLAAELRLEDRTEDAQLLEDAANALGWPLP